MALTQDEREELIQDVVNEITTQSTSIDELEAVTSLDQTESLPAYKKNSTELVKVPIPLISKPAIDAATAANSAASSANSAAGEATAAKNEAIAATEAANTATSNAQDATSRVNQAMDEINTIKETANNADTLSKKLSEQLGSYNVKVTTEGGYEDLETKDDDTLYFCTENEETS
jgi:hypothetical protein